MTEQKPHIHDDEDDKIPSMHERIKALKPYLKLASGLTTLGVVILCVAYLLSQRDSYFPGTFIESNPPVATTLGFAPQEHVDTNEDHPESGSTGTATNTTTVTTSGNTGSSGTSSTTTTTGTTGTTSTSTTSTGTTSSGTASGTTTSSTSTTAGATGTTPPVKIDWTKKAITGPIDGAYVAVFLSRKVITIVVDRQYARLYYYASIPASAKPGTYHIIDHKLRSGVMTLVLDYPSAEDAAKALTAGKITKAQHDAIVSALKAGKAPPTSTPLGGPIAIRGDGGKNTPAKGNDYGITPQQMEELWLAVRKGTTVRILP